MGIFESVKVLFIGALDKWTVESPNSPSIFILYVGVRYGGVPLYVNSPSIYFNT